MKYLLSITIGPVQEFIATARRSRDLWFGSWLLSELSKAAARTIGMDQLIFPSIANSDELKEDSDFNVVNKLLAIVDHPKALCTKIEDAINNRLNRLRDDAFKNFSSKSEFHRDIAQKQTKDLLEFYWAALPLNGDYANTRNEVERLLAARKATRNFKSVGWHNNDIFVPKSSSDGQRESVIDESVYETLAKDELYQQFGVRQGERLCGVGLLKRHGNRKNDPSFFSTSHVAALPLLESINYSKHKSAVESYFTTLTNECNIGVGAIHEVPLYQGTEAHLAFGMKDGHLLFKERLSDYIEDENKLKKAREALHKLLKDLKVSEPFPYYALLLADGDHMGKAIDAQAKSKEGDSEKSNGMTRHKDISKQLSDFASAVTEIVQVEHKGSLVYSGGDDVLAFVPLHTVLDCARALADKFKELLGTFKFNDESGLEKHPTLSVGIAVAHHIDPLSNTLELARQAEKEAKDAGRNAFAVTISKRSGADVTIKGQWGEIDVRVKSFVQLHVTEAIPDGAAFELHQLSRDLSSLPREAIEVEALRILRRKRVKDEKLRENVLKELEKHIQDPNLSLEDLANELIVARTFGKAVKQAGIQAKELLPKADQVEKEVDR